LGKTKRYREEQRKKENKRNEVFHRTFFRLK
jgi:hypothetical protein